MIVQREYIFPISITINIVLPLLNFCFKFIWVIHFRYHLQTRPGPRPGSYFYGPPKKNGPYNSVENKDRYLRDCNGTRVRIYRV